MKTRSIILLVLASLFGLLLLAIIGLYFALRSPSVTSAFVPGLQEVLKDTTGIDTTFGNIRVDLLGDIDLQNVTAKNADMDVAIPQMTLDYSVTELLSGRLVVNSFALNEPKIKMAMVDDGSTPEPEEPTEPPKPLPQLIDHWLNTPDVFINLDDIAIRNADVDVTMAAPTGTTAILLNDLSLNLSTRHVKGSLAADIALGLDPSQPQSFAISPSGKSKGGGSVGAGAPTTPSAATPGTQPAAVVALNVEPKVDLAAKLELKELAEGQWQLSINAPKLNIDADNLAFASDAPDAKLKANIAAHKLLAKVIGDVAINADGDSIIILPGKVDIDVDLKEQGLKLHQRGMAEDPAKPGTMVPTGMDLVADELTLKLADKTTAISTGGIKEFLTKLTSDLNGKVTLDRLTFTPLAPPTPGQKAKQKPGAIRLQQATVDLASGITSGKGDVTLDIAAKNIRGLPGLKQAPTVTAKAKGDLDFNAQAFALNVTANDQFRNSVKLKESYEPTAKGHGFMRHDIAFNLTEALDRYFPKPLLAQDIGYYSGTLKGTTTIDGPVDMFAIDIPRYAKYPANADITVMLRQKKPGRSRMLVHRKPVTIKLLADYGPGQGPGQGSGQPAERTIDAKLAVAGDDLRLKGLKGQMPLRLSASAAAPVDITTTPIGLPRAKAAVDVKAGKGLPQVASLTANITNAPKRLGLNAKLMGNLSRQLIAMLPPLAKAKLFGSRYYGLWRANGAWQGSVRHPHATILSFQPGDENRSRVNITGNLSVAQTARGRLARLSGPLTLRHKLNGSLQKGQLTADLALNQAQLTGLASLRNLKLNTATGYRLDKRGDHDATTKTTLRLQNLKPNKKILPVEGITPFLGDIALDIDGAVTKMDRFTINKLKLRTKQNAKSAKDNIAVDVKGSGSIKNLALQATGAIKGDFPQSSIAGVGLKGAASVPFSATANRTGGKNLPISNLALAIKPDFKGFSVATPDFAVQNLTGTFSIDEQITVNTETKKAKFQYIQSRDPFKRVDYDRIEPFLQSENMIAADKIKFGKAEIGPFRANLAVEQNHVTLPYIATELLDGWYVGKMFLDFKPSQLKLGYLGRITQINLGKLMPTGQADDGKRFSSRLGLELDINRALLEGKVDVTEIGRTQLLQVLGALDPKREDPKLNQARAGLAVGAPSYLGLGFQQGLMDMDIQFEAALVPNMNIKGIPLTSFIEANLSPFKKTLSQIPLE